MPESSERKKMSTLYILEILREYTDDTFDSQGNPKHCLTVARIARILYDNYEIELDRKAVKHGLDDLCNSPYFSEHILFDEGKDGKRTNYRYCQEFDSAEIRYLSDALLFSKNIPESECRYLLERIHRLGDIDSRKNIKKHLYNLSLVSADKVYNEQILNNVSVIDEAIEKKRKISYIYNNYGKDKKLHPVLADGKPVVRTVSPYAMVANNGRYYLKCNYEEYNNVINVRIDKITDIQILDSPAKSKRGLEGIKDVPDTMAEQLYMQSGPAERIVFRASGSEEIISNIVDWFGKNVRFTSDDGKTVTCEVKTNPGAMKFWAMQYSDYVDILKPENLREDLRMSLRLAWSKYNNGKDTLIEPSSGIKKLIKDWKQICSDALEGKVDIRHLGETVRKTHLIILPLKGKEPEGQYTELFFTLEKLRKKILSLEKPIPYAVYLLLRELLNEHERYELRKRREMPDNIMRFFRHLKEGERGYIELDINNFEEDFLTLLQYADKFAQETAERRAEYEKEYEKEKQERARKRSEMNKNRTEDK